ncbi:MAG: multidrug efflux SMR transporter [Pseudomonadota bacterium]
MIAWILLVIAIAFEIVGTSLLKLSDGFEKPLWGGLAIASYWGSFSFLAPALKAIPVGVAYAIWSGVGIVAIAIIGYFFFDQRLSLLQYFFIATILFGAVGLRLTTGGA